MEGTQDRPLVWLHGEVKTPPFSSAARIAAGVLLRRLQRGEELSQPHSRPMPVVGPGCHELRILDKGKSWRIVYYLSGEAVVILGIFSKKTRRTPKRVLQSSQARLKAYLKVAGGRRLEHEKDEG